MRRNLEKGDKIMTIGGFYGRVVGFKDDALIVELKPDNVKVQMNRSSVADVLNKDENTLEAAPSEESEKETE